MSRSKGKKNSGYRRNKKKGHPLLRLFLLLVVCLGIFYGVRLRLGGGQESSTVTGVSSESTSTSNALHKTIEEWPDLDVQLLEFNPYSRVGLKLDAVNGIVIHYTANPGSTAQQNRDYFANLATTQTTKASSHFVVGLDGEIIQCVPCDEISYCSNNRNSDTIAIECCISDDSGVFNSKTYDSLVELTAWLVCRYDLAVDDVIRHYDITGKNCPKDFVENPDKWDTFKTDVQSYILKHGT